MAVHDDRTAWLVKAGPRGKFAQEFITSGLVTVGSDWPGVGDLGALSDAEVFIALEEQGRRKPQDDLVQLRIFSSRMAVGDIVVTPDPSAGDVVFGTVVGDYGHTATPVLGDHCHGRVMDWFGRVSNDLLEPFMDKALGWRGGTLRRLPEQTHWLRLAGEVQDGLGRAADDFPKKKATAARATRKRVSSKPRVAAKPKVVVNPDRLCPSCGLLRAESMFPSGSDYCRDCD